MLMPERFRPGLHLSAPHAAAGRAVAAGGAAPHPHWCEPGWAALLARLADRFLPPDFPGDRRNLVRARLLIVSSALLAVGSLLISLTVGVAFGAAVAPYPGLILIVLLNAGVLALPWLLRRTGALTPLAAVLVLALLLQSILVWFLSGGPTLEFLSLTPVGLLLACFMLNLRAGLAMALLIAALVPGMEAVRDAGLLPAPRLSPEMLEGVTYVRVALIGLGAFLVTACVGQVNDRMEAAYAEACDAAEAASRAKSAFLAGVSHELRTPMTGIMGTIALLEGSPLTPQQQVWVAALRASAEAQTDVLDDILDLSRLQTGDFRARAGVTDVARLIAEVRTLLAPQAAARGIWLQEDLHPDLPPLLLLDGAALRQVLINLAGNAIRATDRGGVTIAARTQMERHGLELVLTLRDTGHGFDPERSPLDAAAALGHAGRGGLAICLRLVAAMGGRLEAFALPQTGASFRITLPVERVARPPARHGLPAPDPHARGAAPPPQAANDLAPAPAGSTTPLDVLVAEDSDTNRMLLGAILQRIGHRPRLVTDGTTALEAVHQAAAQLEAGGAAGSLANGPLPIPDLLLLDIQMPGLTGTEVARAIRATPGPLRDLPILGLTADATPEHRQVYLDAGMDDLLYKPVNLAALQAAITRLGGRRRA